jgi:hypothetical protein
MSLNLSRTFAVFSKFHLSTSNLQKLWSFSWDTTFMLSGISHSKWKIVKKLGQRQQLLFTGAEKDSKFVSSLCKIHGEKPLWAFKSCRGFRDLQLCYSHLGAFMLRNLEINTVKLEEYLGPLSGFWWFNDTHLSG